MTGSGDPDPSDLAALRTLGLRTVIDLRTDAEVELATTSWDVSGANVTRIPIEEGARGSDTWLMGGILDGRITRYSETDLADLYVASVERRAEQFGRIISLLADEPTLPRLIHCTHGKDRTGIAVAILLAALEVPREAITDDYTQTGRNRPDQMDDFVDQIRSAGVDPEQVRSMFVTPKIAVEAVLDHLESAYGSAAAYLERRAGMRPDRLDAVRSLLVDPPEEKP